MFNKSFLFVFAILAFAMSGGTTTYGGPRDSQTVKIMEKAMPSMVRIGWAQDGVVDVIGSGFVVDSRGYILTNHHVIDGVKTILIAFQDKTWYEGEIIYSDEDEDLSLIKIDTNKVLPELRLGPSSDLKVGEPAIVVGNPLDETFTTTTGIISKVNVPKKRDGKTRYLVQTDAAINYGNSGGALLNANGEVVGVVELKKVNGPGLGWAISSDRAARLLSTGASARKIAGVRHGIVSFETKVLAPEAKKGVERQALIVKGLLEAEFFGDPKVPAPAEAAGIKPGDQILKVDDKSVINAFEFERSFWSKKPGDKVKLIVISDGKTSDVTITLAGPGIEPEIKD